MLLTLRGGATPCGRASPPMMNNFGNRISNEASVPARREINDENVSTNSQGRSILTVLQSGDSVGIHKQRSSEMRLDERMRRDMWFKSMDPTRKHRFRTPAGAGMLLHQTD